MSKWSRVVCFVILVVLCIGGFTACSRNPNVRKQKYLESGQRYYEKGKYREAAIQFENAIQVDSRFADAHYRLALTEMKLQQWNNAYQELALTLEIQPENYAAHLDTANLLIASHQLKEAKEHIDLLLQKQPNSAEVQTALANFDAASNDLGAALAVMQKALQLDPQGFTVLRLMGRVCFAGAQLARGAMYLERAQGLRPADVEVNYLLGRYWLERNDNDRAVYFLMQAEDSPERQITSTHTPLAAFYLGIALQLGGITWRRRRNTSIFWRYRSCRCRGIGTMRS